MSHNALDDSKLTLMTHYCMNADFEGIRTCFKDGYLSIKTDIDLFTNMCNHAPVETVKFLWDNQKEFNYKIDLDFNNNEAFTHACYFKKFDNAAYLILEHDIEKKPYVKNFLETEMFEIKPQIMSVIASKELNHKLKSDLTHNFGKIKTPKI